jgi:adenylate cyclase
MVENAKHPIRIDLNEFKLHIDLRNKIALTLHFNSPSRRFYLSLIAFVANEMKKRGKIIPIPLEEYLDLLALLNESIGGSAGSSDKGNLLPRIYRKWQHALPNLEEAPLFKVLGRKKEYEGIGKTYQFTEAEKDSWANLFEYKGSEENVRLRFSIDKLGASLNDIVITYEDSLNGDAWERFISSLKEKVGDKPETKPADGVLKEPEAPVSPIRKWKTAWPGRYRWAALIAAIIVVLGALTLVIWKAYFKPPPVKVASMEKMAFPLPDKPSIVVLPFVNMSDDPKQEFFSDGITEEIITALSRSPDLFVIAQNSTFAYKGRHVKVKQVSEELGIRYVLEGSVRKAGDRVRITAQLVDAITGYHLWAERYDRDLKDIFALQDEITLKVMTALLGKLQIGDRAQVMARGARNLEAFLKAMEGREHFNRQNKEANAMAQKLLEEAIALDPKYAWAYANLGSTHMFDALLGWSKSPGESLARAMELAHKAISLDESDPFAQAFLAYLYGVTRQHDKALSQVERAFALNPNSSEALFVMAQVLIWIGKPEEAIPLLQKALRLNPFPPVQFLNVLSTAYRVAGQYEKAIETSKKAVQREPNSQLAYLYLTAACALAGRKEDARAAAAEVLRINPKFSIERHVMGLAQAYKNQIHTDRFIDALRKAGLK